MRTPIIAGLGQSVVAYRPVFYKLTGRVSSALLLSQVAFWHGKHGREVYKTDREIAEEVGMGIREAQAAKKHLIELGLIQVVKRGTPQRSFYSLNDELCESKLTELAALDQRNSSILIDETRSSNSETTTETTTDISTDVVKPVQEGLLPESMGKTPTSRLVRVYALKYEDLYGVEYKANWPALTKLFKPLLESMTEMQIAALIVLHFEWRGASGEDQFTHDRLAERCFPLEWVPKAVNQYLPYLQNALEVPFTDEAKVKKYVVDSIGQLWTAKKRQLNITT